MVVQWAVHIVRIIGVWLLGLFPSITLPDWAGSVHSAVSTINADIQSVSAWFPFGVTLAVVGVVGLALVVAIGIKVARIALSFLTFGGGSAS